MNVYTDTEYREYGFHWNRFNRKNQQIQQINQWTLRTKQRRKLHYVFDTGSSGIMARARFWGSEGSFEPSS